MAEETGLDVDPYSMFEIFERIIPDAEGKPEYHYVLIDYLCRRLSGRTGSRERCQPRGMGVEQNLSDYRITEGTLGVIERAFAKLQR